jgi:hypothetical protein
MTRRAFIVSLLAAAALGSTASACRAAIMSFTLTNTTTGMAATDVAGAPGVRVGNYNNVQIGSGNQTSNITLNTIKDDSGATVASASLTLTPSAGQNNGVAGNVGGTNDQALFSNFYDQFATPPSTVTITNIPYASYDVYFYRNGTEANAATRAGQFTIGAQDRYVRGGLPDPTSTGTGYVLSNDTTNTGGSITQGNYVVFTGLSGSSLTASFNGVNAGDTTLRNKVVGFQIVQTPEPASAGLVGLAGLGLLARRRRLR